jgi:hypothetical protein
MTEGDKSIGTRGTEGLAVEGRSSEGSATVPRALRQGLLRFGEVEVPCYVLADGTALLTARGILRVFAGGKEGDLRRFLPRIPGISNDFSLVVSVRFRLADNNAIADGYPAEVLIDLCNLYVRALAAGTLHPKQVPLAVRAAVIVTSCAKAGITAAVWEATGYDKIKAAGALQDKLALYLREAAGPWERMFTHEFFLEMARLFHLELRSDGKRPLVFAAFLREFFYEGLDAQLYAALKGKNPRLPELEGERQYRHHQFLTPAARERFVRHQRDVLLLMRTSTHVADFRMRFNAHFRGGGLQLAFGGV